MALGAVTGLAIGALQWLPTALFIGNTQRSEPSFGFISGGSLSFGNLLELLVPHVMGGGPIGLLRYAGGYGLAEVDAYPGTMALIAVAVMITRLGRPASRRWRVWLVVTALGLVLTLGSHTPVERIIAYLPVAGDQRLPSRALLTVALGASLLLGYFLDEWPASPPAAPAAPPKTGSGRLEVVGRPRKTGARRVGVVGRPRRTGARRVEAVAAAVPVAGILAVVIATVVTGKPEGGYLVPERGSGWSVAAVAPALSLSAVLAVAGYLLFVRPPRERRHAAAASPGRRSRQSRQRVLPAAVAAFVVVDLALFVVNQSSLAPAPSADIAAHSPLEKRVAALAKGGRVLVLDPHLSHARALTEVGGPDLGLLSSLAEAGGYSSIMWGPYAVRTGTHTEDGAFVTAFATGTFATLGVSVVLVAPSLLAPGGLAGDKAGTRATALRAAAPGERH